MRRQRWLVEYKKRRGPLLGLAALASVCLAAMAFFATASHPSEGGDDSGAGRAVPADVEVASSGQADIVSSISVSWACAYPDIETVLEAHSLAIVGEVVGSKPAEKDSTFTHHQVKVLDVVKDGVRQVQTGDVITVSQIGGSRNLPSGKEVVYEVQDSPPLREGEVLLLFLNGPDVQPSVSDQEVYLGVSPWTRLVVRNARVYWAGEVYKNVRIPLPEGFRGVNGKTLGEVVSYLKAISTIPGR